MSKKHIIGVDPAEDLDKPRGYRKNNLIVDDECYFDEKLMKEVIDGFVMPDNKYFKHFTGCSGQ